MAHLPPLLEEDIMEDDELPPMEMLEEPAEVIAIPIPAGFMVPDQARNGEPFEARVMLRLDGDGLVIDSLEAGAPAAVEKVAEKAALTDAENDDMMMAALTERR